MCLWTKNEPLNFSPQKLALGSHAGDPWFDPQLDPFAKKAYYIFHDVRILRNSSVRNLMEGIVMI